MSMSPVTDDEWLRTIFDIFPSSKEHPRVAIFGSVDFYHKDSPALCDEIGRELARRLPKICLLTGGNAVVQENISRAFRDEFQSQRNTEEEDPLIFHLVPDGYHCKFGFGKCLHAGRDMEARRYVLANAADVCLSIEGGPGTADEMTKAIKAGKFVVPVIRSGGASAGMFDAPTINQPSFVKESTWKYLGDESASAEVSAKAAVSIIHSALMAKHTIRDIAQVSKEGTKTMKQILSESLKVTYSNYSNFPKLLDNSTTIDRPKLIGSLRSYIFRRK